MQSGDIENTFADIILIKKWVGFKPKVSIEIGILEISLNGSLIITE